MAGNFALDNMSAPTPDSSLSDILGDIKIQRSLVKISSSQKQLLNRNESWASFLSRRPAGFVNVPPFVLDQLKASYKRQKRAAQSPKAVASPSHTKCDADVPEPSGSQSSSPLRAERDGINDDDEDPSNWSSSPERNLRPPSVRSQEPRQPFMTQLPEKSPPQPTIMTSPPPPLERPKPFEFLQGSPGSEDELEVEVPGALAYSPEPVNKSALPLLATPPSAQVVPCTFDQAMDSISATISKKLDPQPKPRSKKHIYKPVPPLYRGPNQVVSSHLYTNVGTSKALMAPGQDNEAQSSLSTDDTSSSVIPSTRDEPNIQIEKQPVVWDARPDQVSNANPSSKNPQRPLTPGQHSTMDMPTSPALVIRSPRPPIPINLPVVPPAVTVGTWEAPFTYYTVTYPSYNGTIQDFVTACIYIQLQYRRIRTSLYDDFIRAWVEGYLPYVKDCDEAQPPRKALRAIEWYNEIDDDPLYTSRVVTRQNLQSILDFYPDELEIARQSFGIASSRGRSKISVSNHPAESHIGQDKQMALQLPEDAQQSKGKEPIRKRGEVVGSVARPSPIVSKAQAPPSTARQPTSTHKSFNGIESGAVQPKSLSRSFSESITDKKRAATDELRSEVPKRVSLGPSSDTHSRIWSESGSTGSNHSRQLTETPRSSAAPEPALGQKSAKVSEDPEERRRRRLAKHFKKQLAGREGIASSAPISGTPRSGQK